MQIRLRSKLMGLLVGASALTLSAAVFTFVREDTRTSAEAKARSAEVLAHAVGQAVQGAVAFDDRDSTERILRTFESEATAQFAAVYKADGSLLGSWRRSANTTVPGKDPHQDGYVGTGHETALWTTHALKSDEGVALGDVVVRFETTDLQARTAAIYRLSAAVLLGCILAAIALASRLHRVVTVPLQSLAATAAEVRRSRDYRVRAAHVSNDEIQVVADGFNEMLQGIQERDSELEGHRRNLESLVEQRTRALDLRNESMRIVLDNVTQGIITLDRDGSMDSERSAAFDAWFGAPKGRCRLDEHIEALDARCASWFRLGLEMLFDDMLPLSVSLAQMPATMTDGRRHFRIHYQPVFATGRDQEDSAAAVVKLLVLFTDVTAELEREQVEQGQREAFHIFQRLMSDRAGLVDFAEEAMAIAERVVDESIPREELLRAVHTLKGNAGLFELSSIVALCHTLEDRMIDDGGTLSTAERASIKARVTGIVEQVRSLMGQRKGVLDVAEADVRQLREAVTQNAPAEILLALLSTWSWEGAAPRFERFAEQARTLARRLGRGDIDVVVDAEDVRLPPERFRSFFAAFAHVVRNAIDHGLEPLEERQASGKSIPARLRLSIAQEAGECVIAIRDDGRGIDWDVVRNKCQRLGLPSSTPAELQDALFADGFSTRDVASETSGRGVGMSVVRAAVVDLGGRIEIDSERGKGCTVRFRIPAPSVAAPPPVRLERAA